MGGWRCSYRNCIVRTDGKTHVFHYPVFDKVRCHQWLVNAGRLDFLNLKVSQLKNRVVCQHHFSDEHFMNFKRDKLTFDAVPCLDGPYCDVSEGENEDLKETSNSLSILFDDIENEYMTLLDKRANYSVKYADFLTSNELDGIDISNIVPQHHKLSEIVFPERENNDSKAFIITDLYERQVAKASFDGFVNNIKPTQAKYHKIKKSHRTTESITPDVNKKYQTQPVLKVPPYKSKPNQNENQAEENILEIELPPGFIDNNNLLKDDCRGINLDSVSSNVAEKANVSISNKIDPTYSNADTKPPESLITKPAKKPAKVKILSEQTISEPVTVIGNLEPVSPSTVLPIIQRKPILQRKPPTIVPREVPNEIIANSQELLLDIKPPLLEQINKESNDKTLRTKEIKEQKVNPDRKVKSPRVSLLKKNITPERIAAIEEKRKFNMKLRDIIESFFGKLDEQDKEIKETKDVNVSNQVDTNEAHNLFRGAKSPNAKDRTIANLEARIKKMEDKLINKIDQNSQRILELKNTIAQSTQKPKKSHATQTSFDDECQKKRLYQEISQYLSPDANSLVYEELFINKYAKGASKGRPAKRKRAR